MTCRQFYRTYLESNQPRVIRAIPRGPDHVGSPGGVLGAPVEVME